MPSSELYSASRTHALFTSILLFIIPILLLPSALLALSYNYAALALVPRTALRRHIRRSTRFHPQTILITGVSSPEGLRIARAFYQTGHNVLGVDNTRYGAARFSKALTKFYALASPRHEDGASKYARGLLNLILQEKVTMWIDCAENTSSAIQAQAKAVIERRTDCVCLAADIDIIGKFKTRNAFLEFVREIGLSAIETHRVQSRGEVHNILNGSRGKKYILSAKNGSASPPTKAVLPKRTLSQTYHDVSQLKVTPSEVWTLEQHMEGQPKYTALSLVVQGVVKMFVVCCKLDSQGGLQLVPPTSGLNEAARRYIDTILQHIDATFSGHLCVEFYVVEKPAKSGVSQQILPIDGRLVSSPTVVLCAGTRGSTDLTRAYMSALDPSTTGLGSFTGLPYDETNSDVVTPHELDIGVYSFGADLAAAVHSLLEVVARRTGPLSFFKTVVTLLSHVISYREALYEFWDPLPAFWYYFMYAPLSNRMELGGETLAVGGGLHMLETNGALL